jgi:hypothetical protein
LNKQQKRRIIDINKKVIILEVKFIKGKTYCKEDDNANLVSAQEQKFQRFLQQSRHKMACCGVLLMNNNSKDTFIVNLYEKIFYILRKISIFYWLRRITKNTSYFFVDA